MRDESPTRERLISAAIELFAAQGYTATTVGAIAQAGGLSPRAGGFYRHFSSKRELLDVAIDRLISEVADEAAARMAQPQADAPIDRLRNIGTVALRVIRGRHPLIRLASREVDHAPEIAAAVRDRLVEPAHRIAAAAFAVVAAPECNAEDVRLAAEMAMGTLTAYVNEEVLFGRGFGGVDDEELLRAWVEVWAGVLGIDPGHRDGSRGDRRVEHLT